MTDGRMLKKQICDSRRLALLKTDSARLLYTWIIPHLDVDGRMSANSFIIKGKVVPRLNQMTLDLIEEYLLDMHINELITLYEADGDIYLYLRKFGDHQKIIREREAPSKCPPPPEDENRNNYINSRPAHDLLMSNSRVTPTQSKLIKGNEMKDNIIEHKDEKSTKQEASHKEENGESPDGLSVDIVKSEYSIEFEKVWDAYNRKGTKNLASKKWEKLSEENKQKVWDYIPEYTSCYELKRLYQKGLEVFINNKCWNDDMEQHRAQKRRFESEAAKAQGVLAFNKPNDRASVLDKINMEATNGK